MPVGSCREPSKSAVWLCKSECVCFLPTCNLCTTQRCPPLPGGREDAGVSPSPVSVPCPLDTAKLSQLASALDSLSSQHQELNPAWLCNTGEKFKSLNGPTQIQVLKDISSGACLLMPDFSVPAAFVGRPSHVEVKTAYQQRQASSFSPTAPTPTLFLTNADKSLRFSLMGQGRSRDHPEPSMHPRDHCALVGQPGPQATSAPRGWSQPSYPPHPSLPVPSRAQCCSRWPCPSLLTREPTVERSLVNYSH